MKKALSMLFSAFALSNSFLRGNKLRSFLSLLGIAIGIFCIVSVLTFAGSMKRNVRKNLETLGLNVVFVEKWPWGFGGGEYRWWDYLSRPEISPRDYKLFKQRASGQVVMDVGFECSVPSATIKYGRKYTTKARLLGITAQYSQMTGVAVYKGRMFNPAEESGGKNLAIIGFQLAEELFGTEDPVGKTIKINGLKTTVAGVFEKQGAMMNKQVDKGIYVPVSYMYHFLKAGGNNGNSRIIVRGFQDHPVEELESEVRRVMRGIRMQRPAEKDNFAMNKMTVFSQQLDSTFVTLDIVAWILGLFSLIVGMFGIANIMFVSVKERTSVIGVQKALGAKNRFILTQFLYESVVLSITGGMAGIVLVWIVSLLVAGYADFPVQFTLSNFVTGISLSSLTGIIAGIVPAIRASRLDPVEAIRS